MGGAEREDVGVVVRGAGCIDCEAGECGELDCEGAG